jgi:hypothetical protein
LVIGNPGTVTPRGGATSNHQISDQGHQYRNRPLPNENSAPVASVLLGDR